MKNTTPKIPTSDETTEIEPAKVGDTLPFLVGGQMKPFEIIQDLGGWWKIRSLDLEMVTRVPNSFWMKQKRIVVQARADEVAR